MKYYLFNGHGDVVQLTGNDGNVTKSYDYDAFGNEKNPDAADTNVFRYCGEYFDKETGTIYLRARYYDLEIGRFTSEDSVWSNKLKLVNGQEIDDPLSLNLYTYCENDPIDNCDPSGHRSKKAADKIIKDNAQNIIDAAEKFGINPAILAATIYAEQRLNVDWKDDLTDGIGGFYGINTSIGVAQVRVSTAKFLEEQGYMPKITAQDGGWDVPGIGFVHGTETMARAKALEDPGTSIMYAAAYLKYFQDTWKSTYPKIGSNTAILATLFNLGHKSTSPNSKGLSH